MESSRWVASLAGELPAEDVRGPDVAFAPSTHLLVGLHGRLVGWESRTPEPIVRWQIAAVVVLHPSEKRLAPVVRVGVAAAHEVLVGTDVDEPVQLAHPYSSLGCPDAPSDPVPVEGNDAD